MYSTHRNIPHTQSQAAVFYTYNHKHNKKRATNQWIAQMKPEFLNKNEMKNKQMTLTDELWPSYLCYFILCYVS